MKLLVDAHCFDYKTSEGVNTYVEGLYKELIKMAPDIRFYFLAGDVKKVKALFGEAENVEYVSLQSGNKIKRLLYEIPSLIKKYGIDVAHYQYTSPLWKNCKTVVTLHDILFKDYPEYFPASYKLSKDVLFRLSAKRADLLLTVSEYSKHRIAKYYQIPEEQIVVTPDAVSEDFFTIDETLAREYVQGIGIGKYLLYVSRIEPRKNQIALLKTYLELKLWEREYDLVFIGRKTLPVPEFEACLSELPEAVRKRIHIYNQVEYHHLLYWYKAANLFVYPSWAEGFGIPPIEAGAAGVPCVCSIRTAMADFSFFGELRVDPADMQAFKDAINKALERKEEEEVLKEIQTSIKVKYNWRIIAENYLEVLRNI